jgi:FkbM family methyltransferase
MIDQVKRSRPYRAALDVYLRSLKFSPVRVLGGATVWMAYRRPGGFAHRLVRRASGIVYGMSAGRDGWSWRVWRLSAIGEVACFDAGLVVEDLGHHPVGLYGLRVWCSSRSVGESDVYLRGHDEELALLMLFERYVSPGDVAIDVGANVGTHASTLSRLVGPDGLVLAFEPSSAIRPRLKANLELNRATDNVVLREAAAWSIQTTLRFEEDESNYNQGVGHADPHGTREVEAVTLDDELSGEDRPVSLLKVDVEGFEDHVLRGAAQTLARHRPVIVIEYADPPWSLPDLVASLPYQADVLRAPNTLRERLEPITPDHEMHGWNNLVIVPRA